MRTTVRIAIAVGAALLVGAAASGTAVARPAASRPGSASGGLVHWHAVFRAPGSASLVLGVVADRRLDTWALVQAPFHGSLGYAVHWNGRRWRVLPIPRGFEPDSIFASSPTNVWLLGIQHPQGVNKAYRWDGSDWKTVPQPLGASPLIVKVIGPSDAWATGQKSAFHWNGVVWTPVPYPLFRIRRFSLSATRGTVWAAVTTGKINSQAAGRILIFRWTGSTWRRLRVPRPRTRCCGTAVVVSPSDIWYMGPTSKSSPGSGVRAYWHWNGRRLTRLPLARFSELIVPDGHGGLWASARAHWTGERWQFSEIHGCLPIGGVGQGELVAVIPRTRTALAPFECAKRTGLLDHAYIDASGPLP
jgi:hypothetical protein